LARVSVEDQSKGYSIEEQLDWCHNACNAHGWEAIVPEYVQEGGHSDDIDYPALRRLLTDVYEGKVKRLVARYHDRIARGDNLKLVLEWLQAWGVKLHVGDLPEVGEDAMDILLPMLSAQGKLFLRKLRERTREGVARAQAAGKHVGRPIAGFKYVDGKLTPDTSKPLSRLAKRNLALYNEKGEAALLKAVKARGKKSRERFDRVKARRLEEQREFRIWLERHRPLASERVRL
jgi:DNA invertase Pin-like site-specific DNA recombinase